jgi:hypothetical protein
MQMNNTIRVKNPQVASGTLFLLIGLFGIGYALKYRLGSGTEMGPGYFPMGVSLVLALIGLITVIGGFTWRRTDPAVEFQLAPLIIVFGVVVFGVVIDKFGFVPAVAVLTLLTCYQRWFTKPLEVLLMVIVMVVVTTGLFIYLLGMPFPMFNQ